MVGTGKIKLRLGCVYLLSALSDRYKTCAVKRNTNSRRESGFNLFAFYCLCNTLLCYIKNSKNDAQFLNVHHRAARREEIPLHESFTVW